MMTEAAIHSQHQQVYPPLISSPSIQTSRLQQQHIYSIGQPVVGDVGNIGGGTTSTTAIPLDLAIQQNMTVQELIQVFF